MEYQLKELQTVSAEQWDGTQDNANQIITWANTLIAHAQITWDDNGLSPTPQAPVIRLISNNGPATVYPTDYVAIDTNLNFKVYTQIEFDNLFEPIP